MSQDAMLWLSRVAMGDLAKSGMGVGEFQVLMCLLGYVDYENHILTPQSEMAEKLGMDRSNFNRAVKRLVERGVIEKGAEDRANGEPATEPRIRLERLGKEPCRLSRPGAQEANGEGRDQGRDRGRPASPRARPGHAGHVRRLRPPEQHQGSDVDSLHIAAQCTFETAKCALTTCYASPCSDPSACGRRA